METESTGKHKRTVANNWGLWTIILLSVVTLIAMLVTAWIDHH